MLLTGCKDNSTDTVLPNTSPTSTHTTPTLSKGVPDFLKAPSTATPDAVALFYCRMTQGPIPHWQLIEYFTPVLGDADQRSGKAMRDDAIKRFPDAERPHYVAREKVMAQLTQCTIDNTQDEGTTRNVLLTQRIPNLREPTQALPGLQTATSHAEREAIWMKGFNDTFQAAQTTPPTPAWQPYQSFTITLTLVEATPGHWVVKTDYQAKMQRPLEEGRLRRQVQDALARKDTRAALEALREGCPKLPDATLCNQLQTAISKEMTNQPTFNKVTLGAPKLIASRTPSGALIKSTRVVVANNEKNILTMAHAEWRALNRHGSIVRQGICPLSSAQPVQGYRALRIPPGGFSEAFCRVPGDLSAEVEQMKVVLRSVDFAPAPDKSPSE